MARPLKYAILALLLALPMGLLGQAALPPVPSGEWVYLGEMGGPRTGAAAALLGDGRVLITGGSFEGVALATAEVLDTVGAFAPVAPMQTARTGHVAVAVKNGRVLVAGGKDATGTPTNLAEIFDPVTDQWTPVGPMLIARAGHSASVPKDGRVLLAGGKVAAGVSASLEIFDTEAGTFAEPRTGLAAAVMNDGQVFVAGGSDGSAPLQTTEIYDPETGQVAAGPPLPVALEALTATTLLNGQVFVAGAQAIGDQDVMEARVFDPVLESRLPPRGGAPSWAVEPRRMKAVSFAVAAAWLRSAPWAIADPLRSGARRGAFDVVVPACGSRERGADPSSCRLGPFRSGERA